MSQLKSKYTVHSRHVEAKVDNTLNWRLLTSGSEAAKFSDNSKNKHTFYFSNHSQIFSLCLNFSLCHKKIFSLCLKIFPCVKAKFPVFSLSGKIKNQIQCFPCTVATLICNAQSNVLPFLSLKYARWHVLCHCYGSRVSRSFVHCSPSKLFLFLQLSWTMSLRLSRNHVWIKLKFSL